jgi:hypothetical protein
VSRRATKSPIAADAKRLARELLARHGPDYGRRAFLDAMGRPPYSTGLGAADTLRIWSESLPKPPRAPEKTWNPPAVKDPTGRDRWLVVRSLVDHGLRPASLADAALGLIESGTMDREDAIAWARDASRVAVRSGTGYLEPWVQEAHRIITKARRTEGVQVVRVSSDPTQQVAANGSGDGGSGGAGPGGLIVRPGDPHQTR